MTEIHPPKEYGSIAAYASEYLEECEEIAIMCGEFSEHDGIGRVAQNQVKKLSEEGYEITVITFNNSIGDFGTVDVREISTPDSFVLNRIFRTIPVDPRNIGLLDQLTEMDAIIAHQYPLTLFASLTQFMSSNTKYILYNHGEPTRKSIVKHLSQSPIEMAYNLSIHELGRLSFMNADDAISISNFARQRLFSQIGMDSRIIYNSIDDRFHEKVDEGNIRQKHSIGRDTDFILFVGRIDPSKGLSHLIKAFEKLSENDDCVLVIVGKPSYDEYYQDLQDLSSDSVIFTGFVPDEELPHYYAACDLYATASLWEGFNLPLAEAQACGKPVVAFDIGPHSEILELGTLVEAKNTREFANAMEDWLS